MGASIQHLWAFHKLILPLGSSGHLQIQVWKVLWLLRPTQQGWSVAAEKTLKAGTCWDACNLFWFSLLFCFSISWVCSIKRGELLLWINGGEKKHTHTQTQMGCKAENFNFLGNPNLKGILQIFYRLLRILILFFLIALNPTSVLLKSTCWIQSNPIQSSS